MLITPNEVKQITTATVSIADQWLNPSIKEAELTVCNNLLGKDLFNELVAQNDANTLTPDNQELLDKLKTPLAYYTFYYSLPDLWIKSTEKGIVFKNSEFSANVDSTTMEFYSKMQFNKCLKYLDEVRNYLDDNTTLYPLYKSSCKRSNGGGFSITVV